MKNKSTELCITSIILKELENFGEGNGTPLQYSCLENPMGRSLVGCRLWGRRVGHDWSDLAAAAAELYTGFPGGSV